MKIKYVKTVSESDKEIDQKIEACPFCASSDFNLHSEIGNSKVFCRACETYGPIAMNMERAIHQWNDRGGKLEWIKK